MTETDVSSSPAPAVKTPSKEASSAAPIFGSASTFSSGSGFAGFTGIDSSKSKAVASQSAENEEEEDAGNDEECGAEYAPVVQLQEVETSTGEETETALFDVKCKLYRFDNEAGEWKERGTGKIKLLEDKETQRVRLLMREEKTLKIRANHIVMPGTKLQEHTGSDKAWVWSTMDFASEEQRMELFCLKLPSPARAQEFKKLFEESMQKNATFVASAESEETAEDTHANGSAAQEDQSQDKATSELADSMTSKAKVEDA